MASSATPTSTIRPWARSRATGRGGVRREASTSWDPSGSCRASSATTSRHSVLSSSSTWSRTSDTGPVMVEAAATTRGTAVPATDTPVEARTWNTPGSIGSTRSRAVAR
jgi:hypothetical protein